MHRINMHHVFIQLPRLFLPFTVAAALLLTSTLTQPAFADDTPTAALEPRIFLPNLTIAPAPDTASSEHGPAADPLPRAAAVNTYYVDCAAGDDANTGQSPAAAWRSLPKANQATLNPGDQLLLKRGCTFPALLDARWFGTAAQPILIGAYGAGNLPIIQNPDAIDVRITGAYQIIENLHATGPAAATDCAAQTLNWKVGFEFKNGAAYNTLRNSKASHNAIGIRTSQDSHHNRILANTLTDNSLVWEIYPAYAQGAQAIQLHGNYQEVAHNYFANNKSACAYNGNYEHISIELYEASNSLIHHNLSYDRTFSELGSTSNFQAANNTYAYNLHIGSDYGSAQGARFIITRGRGHQYGPVLNTVLIHNTVYLTGNDSKGVTCWPCGLDILTMRDNILWVDPEPFSTDKPFVESNNLFWSTNGAPLLNWRNGFSKSPTSQVADPKFVDPANGNFTLRANSPARDLGSLGALPPALRYDLAGLGVPTGPQADIGAYEFLADPLRLTTLPGRIEAENYKTGGEGVGYHDTTAQNIGGAYRYDTVDIQRTKDLSGSYNVGWIAPGEWLAYEINVPAPGVYRIVARIAAPQGASKFHIEIDGVNLTGAIPVPPTGGWQLWADAPLTFPLAFGPHTLRFVAETNGFNLNYLDIAKN